MEQALSCYSPGGAVMGNRRVPAQRLPIPDPFSRKEKQSRMSEAQVGINEGARGRQMGPSEDLRPQQWTPEQCQWSRWKKRPYSTLLLPGFGSWNEETNGMLSPPSLSPFGGPRPTLLFLWGSASEEGRFRGRLWAEGLDQVFGWVNGEHRLAGWFLHNEVVPGFNVLQIWCLVGEGSERWFVLEMMGWFKLV